MNTVARTRAKWKVGYFFVVHPVPIVVYTVLDSW